jgi:hypothetical protein
MSGCTQGLRSSPPHTEGRVATVAMGIESVILIFLPAVLISALTILEVGRSESALLVRGKPAPDWQPPAPARR